METRSVPYGSVGGGGGGSPSVGGGGGGGGGSSAGQAHPIAIKLTANKAASGINNSFFFNCYSSFLKLLKTVYGLFT